MIQANSINEIRFYRCYCTTVLFKGIIQRDYSTGLFNGITQRDYSAGLLNDVQNDRAG